MIYEDIMHKIPAMFWSEEAKEPAHKGIKNALLAAGETQPKKKSKKKVSSKAKGKIHKVMKEYKEGKLHSGSKKGPKVANRKQAIAIAMSEARRKRK